MLCASTGGSMRLGRPGEGVRVRGHGRPRPARMGRRQAARTLQPHGAGVTLRPMDRSFFLGGTGMPCKSRGSWSKTAKQRASPWALTCIGRPTLSAPACCASLPAAEVNIAFPDLAGRWAPEDVEHKPARAGDGQVVWRKEARGYWLELAARSTASPNRASMRPRTK